ncbi:hypothetical protein SAMN05444416_11860 [Thermoactinomyces sp. DSM 45892]|nr:hypothetical protein SAMN05444416_11860 [Thermoactinomyces sp. DSM 45892]
MKDFHTYYVSNLKVLTHNTCGPIWSKGRHGDSVKNAYEHYKKHVVAKGEFPEYQNSLQYVKGAHDFVKNPPAGTLTKKGDYGKTFLYHESSNTFAVTNRNGVSQTMYRPTGGIRHYNNK